MASSVATQRLRKELKALMKDPVANIRAMPHESNILEWHYVLEGGKGTAYAGGWYHGVVKFPKEYPFKPPSIEMYTPNGRFKTNTKLCLSMSDFHPETWNPLWSVGTILTGLYSFMLEEGSTYGSIVTPAATKTKLAKDSLATNIKDKMFKELFPELVELHDEQVAAAAAAETERQKATASSKVEPGVTTAATTTSTTTNDSAAAATSPKAATATAGAATEAAATAEGGEQRESDVMSWIMIISIFVVVVASTTALPMFMD
jgi:ubiquitin-conjugating enzyme E2 J2